MKAMMLRQTGALEGRPLEEAERPDPRPVARELLIRVRACAICRTDLHVIEGDLEPRRLPIIPGHQVVGVVEEAGPGCRRFGRGDRVGVAWLRGTCGRCRWCRSGRENLCPGSRYTGWHEDGGYAERTTVREDFTYAIPDAFTDLEAAPLLCAGIIGYRALARARVPERGRLALYGFGSSAHVVIQLAMHRGHEVYVCTRGESHRALARSMGAAWVGDTLDPPPEPVDGAIVFAPAGEVVPPALRALDRGGTVALAGIHMTPVPEMDYESCLFHEKTLQSVEANTRADGRALLAEAAEIPIRPRVTAFSLGEANEALLRLKRDGIDGTGVLMVEED